jgi:hypothetical protein
VRDERLIKALTCGIGALLALAAVIVAVVLATQPPTQPEITRTPAPIDRTVWPCLNEDGSGQPEGRFPCYWLGGENGKGRSLLYLGPDTNPITISATPAEVLR